MTDNFVMLFLVSAAVQMVKNLQRNGHNQEFLGTHKRIGKFLQRVILQTIAYVVLERFNRPSSQSVYLDSKRLKVQVSKMKLKRVQ